MNYNYTIRYLTIMFKDLKVKSDDSVPNVCLFQF